MRNPKKRGVAVAALTTIALVASTTAALAATVPSSNVKVTDTTTWTPSSPDPSGITYLPTTNQLIVADAEVDEIPAPYPGQYKGVNLYTTTLGGALVATGTTKESATGWSVEPTGLAYGKGNLYVSDDDKKSIFTITSPGGDGVYGTADDLPATPKGFKVSTFGNTDPEGVAYDPVHDELLLINGQTGARFYRLSSGVNGVFDGVAPGGDDVPVEIDLERYGVIDPEGIAYDASRNTILVSSDGSQAIFELDRNGALLNTINLASMGAVEHRRRRQGTVEHRHGQQLLPRRPWAGQQLPPRRERRQALRGQGQHASDHQLPARRRCGCRPDPRPRRDAHPDRSRPRQRRQRHPDLPVDQGVRPRRRQPGDAQRVHRRRRRSRRSGTTSSSSR